MIKYLFINYLLCKKIILIIIFFYRILKFYLKNIKIIYFVYYDNILDHIYYNLNIQNQNPSLLAAKLKVPAPVATPLPC